MTVIFWRRAGREDRGSDEGHEEMFGCDEHVYYLACGVSFTNVCTYVKTYQNVYLNMCSLLYVKYSKTVINIRKALSLRENVSIWDSDR